MSNLLTRAKDLPTQEFQTIGDRLMRLLGEEALARLPAVVEGEVETPCGAAQGLVTVPGPPVCVVSIVRSGDILQEAVRYLQPGVSVGKILIQRDESKPDKPAILYYKKLPKNISESFVILVDPMLATGGSAIRALEVLKVGSFSVSALSVKLSLFRTAESKLKIFSSSTWSAAPRVCRPWPSTTRRSRS